MKKYLFLLTFLSFTLQISFSQITFEKTFGNNLDVERGFCAKQTYDGGYIVVGTNFGDETGSGFIMLIKTDSLGNELWSKGFPDFSLCWSWAYSLKITYDSGFIITGGSADYGGISMQDIFLLKTDKDGNQQWVATYDSLGSYPFYGYNENGNDVIQTNDGGYLVTGVSAGSYELLLLKTDTVGNIQWVAKDTGLSKASGNALIEVENNNYLIIGTTTANLGNTPKMYLAKFDSVGNKIWGQNYGWSQGDYAVGNSVKVNAYGEYVLLGTGRYNGSQNGEMLLIKTDTAGNVLWENSFLTNNYTNGYALDITNDNGYILTGSANCYDLYLVKTDSSGSMLWDTTYSGDIGLSVQQTFDNGYVIAGTKMNDIYLLKTTDNGIILSTTEISTLVYTLCIYPNPTSGSVKILLKTKERINFNIEINDLSGRKINSKNNLRSNEEIIFVRKMFNVGINFIKIYTNYKLLYSRKIIIN